MSDIAVQASAVWKKFHRGEIHDSLRDFVPALARRLVGRGPKRSELAEGDFWALRDVDFEVRQGEVLGIVGANGAGKSTLLKLLAHILKPNRGSVRVNGRLGALIEVGAGFHPDLTGRENIYLNGSILGMKKREIDGKFDRIVDFAGIGPFLDTPVKRYSSGMHARLGFAVAAHLEPEVLIVDEVLAVGDAAFQKKCLGEMEDVARSGRTVLFVSHNMQAVTILCTRALLLHQGRVVTTGSTRDVIDAYLTHYVESRPNERPEAAWEFDQAPGGETARLRAVRVLDGAGRPAENHAMDQPITLEMEYWVSRPGTEVTASFHVCDRQGVCLFAVSTLQDPARKDGPTEPGVYRSRCFIPANYLNEGLHRVSAYVVEDKTRWPAHKQEAVSFTVVDPGASRGGYTGGWIGMVRPLLPWAVERIGDLR